MRPSAYRRFQAIFYGAVSVMTAVITLAALPFIQRFSSEVGFALYLGISAVIILLIRLGAGLLVARNELDAEQRERWHEEIAADLSSMHPEGRWSLRRAAALWLVYSSVARLYWELARARRRREPR